MAWSTIERELVASSVEFCLHQTSSIADVQTLVGDASIRSEGRFAVIGGDGAAHLLLNCMMQHTWPSLPTMAIIPAGTGCDFARTLNIPQSPQRAARLLSNGSVTPVDIGSIQGSWGLRYFLNLADIGIAAVAAHRAEQLRFLGGFRYLAALWFSMPTNLRRHRIRLETDEGSDELRGVAVIVANGRFFGRGFEVAPQANVNDHTLDVLSCSAAVWSIPRLLLDVARGKHLERKDVQFQSSRNIRVEAEGLAVEADGEYLGLTPATICVIPSAINMMVPSA